MPYEFFKKHIIYGSQNNFQEKNLRFLNNNGTFESSHTFKVTNLKDDNEWHNNLHIVGTR